MPIFALCNYEIDKQKYDTFKYVRCIKDNNAFLLIESLKQEKWDNVLQTDDVNLVYTNFVSRFSTLYNHHCPVEKVIINQACKKKPWFRNGLKNACRKKNVLYRTFLRDRTQTAESPYKTYKNKLISILRLAEKHIRVNCKII